MFYLLVDSRFHGNDKGLIQCAKRKKRDATVIPAKAGIQIPNNQKFLVSIRSATISENPCPRQRGVPPA